MTSSAVAPAAPPGALERELKFVLAEGRGALARRLLDALCRPDPLYPAAVVSTIYYDTPDLRLLAEKIDSDYLKTKVRLRWYGPLEGRGAGEGSFLEVKTRAGSLRTKVRTATPLPARALDDMPLDDPALLDVLRLLLPLGLDVPVMLRPSLLVRYRRYRYVEPISGARVSLDTDIHAPRADPRLLRNSYFVSVPAAVLEIKGETDQMPRALRPLLHLGARRRSFSKFGSASLSMLRTD
jgi:hypothetical protein